VSCEHLPTARSITYLAECDASHPAFGLDEQTLDGVGRQLVRGGHHVLVVGGRLVAHVGARLQRAVVLEERLVDTLQVVDVARPIATTLVPTSDRRRVLHSFRRMPI